MRAEFDIVVYGATGYTGRLVAARLAQRFGATGELSFAIAGRNRERLNRLRDELGLPDLAVLAADPEDAAAMDRMASSGRVVLAAAGPFLLYGEAIAAACARTGTDYLDLAGETPFIRRLIDTWGETARHTGARMAPSAGFDSIPSELGVLMVQTAAEARFGTPHSAVKGRVMALRSGLSGGSAASVQAMIAAEHDPAVAVMRLDPFALTPGFRGPPQPDARALQYDADLGAVVGPFVMADINTKAVHRLNYLLGHPWGHAFAYDEMSVLHDGKPVDFDLSGLAEFGPGQGPDQSEREAGHYTLRYVGLGPADARTVVTVQGDADPGYGGTAKIMCEAAVCLLQDCQDQPGGVWTPGALMGLALRDRLAAHAGMTFLIEA